jgi:hypothetical protein
MRIALVLASNLYMSPYVRYYTEILDKMGVSYDIVSWNRFGVEEADVQAFNLRSRLDKNIVGKMIDSFRYCRFVKSRLRQGAYDKLVVFTLQNALMLCPFLKKRYAHNYIVDIRDYSVAQKFFRHRLPGTIQNAAMTVISSSGYKAWLPQASHYVIGHNTSAFRPLEMRARIEGQTTYKILTIGAIGYYDANRAMIEHLADSPMFELEFVGSGLAEQVLKDFVASHKIKNVSFRGRYAKQDEPRFLEGVTLISILMDDSINSMTLMSNRFYLSLIYGIPMMVDSGTEQARWVEKYDLGVVIDKRYGIKEQIVRYLRAFDRERFDAGRKASLQIVLQDVDEFESKLKKVFSCDA